MDHTQMNDGNPDASNNKAQAHVSPPQSIEQIIVAQTQALQSVTQILDDMQQAQQQPPPPTRETEEIPSYGSHEELTKQQPLVYNNSSDPMQVRNWIHVVGS
jgi:hypothetical protein